ncbi:hypothetical protein HGRIS_004538 [Hohenbuehelia grisea]|uniref:Tyrosine specific protein phosphatases domain-containing protein n=1 Tax=Hohenbuehelia grisea TaxID=104357 RepID=A0ABR3JCB8_9AGAR
MSIERPSSVPVMAPALRANHPSISEPLPPMQRPSSISPDHRAGIAAGNTSGLMARATSDTRSPGLAGGAASPAGAGSGSSLDLLDYLQRAGPSVVKSRSGSVLSRGFILKTDHYPSGRALDLDLNVHGAPNFRAPRLGGLNVFGAAQPRTQGLRAILSALRCRPDSKSPTHVVWFSTREEPIIYISGRPFVLRDVSEPRRTLSLSDRAENLEAIELRMKNDILQESSRYGGLVLTHNEMASDSGEGAILPTWTSVDSGNVKTSRELWESMKAQGWNVDYYRIPISPDRPIEDNYLDAYLRVIKELDPQRTALVFSCGMGAVRTTFAMVAASVVRRKQLIARGLGDPYAAKGTGVSSAATPAVAGTPSNSGVNTVCALALASMEFLY